MTELFEEPGPRARGRLQKLNIVAIGLLCIIVAVVVYLLAKDGQFAGQMWSSFTLSGTWQALGRGTLATLRATIMSIVLSVIVGILFALMRESRNFILRSVGSLIVELFRALPPLLLALFVYLALGAKLQSLNNAISVEWIPSWIYSFPEGGVFWALVLAVTSYESAVICELIRAGIGNVPLGQSEAADAMGMSYLQRLRFVVGPQAIRIMTPALVNELVTIVKFTSIGFVVGYIDLLNMTQLLAQQNDSILPTTFVAACIYIAMNLVIRWIAHRLDEAFRAKEA